MSERKFNILFVDDDTTLLQGLRRMLHPMQGEWHMAFKGGGATALAHMSSHPIDVVVSDMRMPEMDGVQFLGEVGKRHPEAVRIILSGYSKDEMVAKATGMSHQYLAKPCEPKRLIETIRRSLEVRDILKNERLRSFVTGLAKLPSPSATVRAVQAEIDNPKASTGSLAEIIERDVALSAKVLKLSNSAYFALPTRITDCRQAVQFLGLETMRGLITIAAFFSEFEDDPVLSGMIERLSGRCVAIGGLAREIAAIHGAPSEIRNYACSAGLLSHVGTILLIGNFPDEFRRAGDIADRGIMDFLEAERLVFNATHAEVGAYLLGLWGFPTPVIEAVAFHHAPQLLNLSAFGAVSAVHIAQALMRDEAEIPASRDGDRASNLDMTHIEAIGLSNQVAMWHRTFQRFSQERLRT